MGKNKNVVKIVVIFTSVTALITLIFMLISTCFSQKDRMVIDGDTLQLVQLEEPEEGDPIAVIETSLGQMRMVLYPEYAPASVANFIELAESGYYDDTYVFHSEDGVYSAMGSKLKKGTMPDGYDKSKELIQRELHQNLWPFKGAVCSLNTTVDRGLKEMFFGGGTYYCGSRLAVINSIEFTDDIKTELMQVSGSEAVAEAFIKNGGIPNFSQQMTVIGQIYEGLDVVEALASLETEFSENDTYKIPKDDVKIISVEIGEYEKENESSENTEK